LKSPGYFKNPFVSAIWEGGEKGAHCSFHLYFSDDLGHRTSFHVLIASVDIFSCDTRVQLLPTDIFGRCYCMFEILRKPHSLSQDHLMGGGGEGNCCLGFAFALLSSV
jgi:hypothetical protein